MKNYEIKLVLGTMVGCFIVCFSSNSTTILQLFGLIIGMAIVAGTTAYYGCKRMVEYQSLNSMQEEPAKDLEEVAKHYLYSNILYDDVYVGKPTEKDCIEMFEAGAKWQKEQMMAKAIDATIEEPEPLLWEVFVELEGLFIVENNLHDGDSVKVIIVKEE